MDSMTNKSDRSPTRHTAARSCQTIKTLDARLVDMEKALIKPKRENDLIKNELRRKVDQDEFDGARRHLFHAVTVRGPHQEQEDS